MASTVKKISNYLPPLKDQGMDYLTAANAAGLSIQTGTVASADTAGDTITLTSQMANATYMVIIVNETDVARNPSQAAKTTTSFDYGNEVNNADVLSYVVIGQLDGQTAP